MDTKIRSKTKQNLIIQKQQIFFQFNEIQSFQQATNGYNLNLKKHNNDKILGARWRHRFEISNKKKILAKIN